MESKRMFDRFVSVGNVKAAIRLVTEQNSGQCLPLNSVQADGRAVKEHLLDKHPVRIPASVTTISDSPQSQSRTPSSSIKLMAC